MPLLHLVENFQEQLAVELMMELLDLIGNAFAALLDFRVGRTVGVALFENMSPFGEVNFENEVARNAQHIQPAFDVPAVAGIRCLLL